MIEFESLARYLAARSDVSFWMPYLERALAAHGFARDGQFDSRAVMAGTNGTHPTFIVGDLVVKFFGHTSFWRTSHRAELRAMRFVSSHKALQTPSLLAAGQLFTCQEKPWPYLITTRVEGEPWSATMARPRLERVAAQLGQQLRLLHRLPSASMDGLSQWRAPGVVEALSNSAFPPHLKGEVLSFLANLPQTPSVVVHGDLVLNHVWIKDGRLAAIIDWGDAVVASPYYDIGKVYFHTFGGDLALWRIFLDAYQWDISEDFACLTLGWALRRQAVGLAQHHRFDIFNHLPALVPLAQMTSLEQLAHTLFWPR